jgi:hypothetical protein
VLFLSVLRICARNKRTQKHKAALRSTISAKQQERRKHAGGCSRQAVRAREKQRGTTSILAIIVNWAPFFLANSLTSTSHLLSCDPNWLHGNAMMSAQVREVRVVYMHIRPNGGSAAAPTLACGGMRGDTRWGSTIPRHFLPGTTRLKGEEGTAGGRNGGKKRTEPACGILVVQLDHCLVFRVRHA